MSKKIRVGIVGLGFGAEFIPIYQAHPDAELVALSQRSENELDQLADHFGIERRYTEYQDMLDDPEIDAIHINTPIGSHADQSVAALDAGKHVACTVPMATSVEDCARVVDAKERSGKTYMMMETSVYTREFLYAQALRDSGQLGRIQFLRGAHMQDMTAWPEYWRRVAPMHYATHAVAPLLALAQKEAGSVRCLGSGHVESHTLADGSAFSVETAVFALRDSDLAMEVTRSLYGLSREYVESFDVYAENLSLEWPQLEADRPVAFRGEIPERFDVPDYGDRLPESIREYTQHGVYDAEENRHLSFTQGSGHGGSHPHLVHEFVRSIVEQRDPFPDVYASANWTSAGICAHTSALTGVEIELPRFGVRQEAGVSARP